MGVGEEGKGRRRNMKLQTRCEKFGKPAFGSDVSGLHPTPFSKDLLESAFRLVSPDSLATRIAESGRGRNPKITSNAIGAPLTTDASITAMSKGRITELDQAYKEMVAAKTAEREQKRAMKEKRTEMESKESVNGTSTALLADICDP